MRKAAFFDRDGTINRDTGYLHKPEYLEFLPGTPELIKCCNTLDYLVVVVTNQSGIARGLFAEKDLHLLHHVMRKRLLDEFGAQIDAFYFCPHLPEITGVCDCRKPKPGLFLQAMSDWDIDPTQSVSFGDAPRDEEASRMAGIPRFYYPPFDENLD